MGNQKLVYAVTDWPADYAEQFWRLYPRRVARKPALRALDAIRRAGVSFEVIMAGLRQYAGEQAGTNPKFIAHAATWLNEERWNDEPNTYKPKGRPGEGFQITDPTLRQRQAQQQIAEREAWLGKRH